MKDKLIKAIREVPIADKTYPEYIEAIADKLIDEGLWLRLALTTSSMRLSARSCL